MQTIHPFNHCISFVQIIETCTLIHIPTINATFCHQICLKALSPTQSDHIVNSAESPTCGITHYIKLSTIASDIHMIPNYSLTLRYTFQGRLCKTVQTLSIVTKHMPPSRHTFSNERHLQSASQPLLLILTLSTRPSPLRRESKHVFTKEDHSQMNANEKYDHLFLLRHAC